MNTYPLKVVSRKTGPHSELNKLRKEGQIPAVIYGLTKDPETVSLAASDFRTINRLANKNVVVEIQNEGKSQNVIVFKIDKDPVKPLITHIDFLRVDEKHPVTVKVPIRTTGIPVGVKTDGGIFSVMKKWVKVKAPIQHIPEAFEDDITELASGKVIYVRDLKFEKGIFVTPMKTALYGVTSGKKADETAAASTATATPATAKPVAAAAKTAAKPAAKAAEAKPAKK